MNLKNKKLITVFVVPVVIIAAVAGYYLYPVEEPLRIEEGYAEMTIEYIKVYGDIIEGYQPHSNATAISYIDDKNNSLEFKIHIRLVSASKMELKVDFDLYVKGNFINNYNLKELQVIGGGLGGENVSLNGYDFSNSYTTGENVDLWPPFKYNSGTRGMDKAFIGFDLTENNFSAETRVTWTIPKENWDNEYTIRFESTVKDRSLQDITSTIDIHILEEENS